MNFLEILYPSFSFLSILISGGLFSLAICKYNGIPFIHPKNSIIKKINSIIPSVTTNCLLYTLVYKYHSQPLLLLNERNISALSVIHILEYIAILEFLFYFYHRLVHIKYLYKWVHAQHHMNIIVYPIDYLDVHIYETLGIMITKNFPLYFIHLNYSEYVFVYFLYTVGGFLTHSDFSIQFHSFHHKSFKCNYCYLFPIYDVVFGTANFMIE